MHKRLNQLLATVVLFSISYTAAAQSDSLLDLGRVKLRKDFAQTVTIKGKYLEQIPFANINDVIAPWLLGTQVNRYNLVYVVDGNIMNDVNAYSIHDIEEITLVQNAMVNVNGADISQQLVLIKTKRKYAGKKGMIITGSTQAVKNEFYPVWGDPSSKTNLFHQYQVTAWKNAEKIKFGLSAGFMHDVYPLQDDGSYKVYKPWHLNRFRLNGWFDLNIAEGHSLSASLNVVPQKNEFELHQTTFNSDNHYKSKRTLIYPSIKLSNRIIKGLVNELSLSYLTNRNPASSLTYRVDPTTPPTIITAEAEALEKYNSLLVRENLGYTAALGDWTLGGSLNLAYRSEKINSRNASRTIVNGVQQNATIGYAESEFKTMVLTPSVSLTYRNLFNVVGGISKRLDDETTESADGIFPFGSISLEVLKLFDKDNASSVKIFGSYAKPADMRDNSYRLQDLMFDVTPPPIGPIFGPNPGPGIITTYLPYPDDPTMRSITAGARFTSPNDKLQVSYNFYDRRNVYPLSHQLPIPVGWETIVTWADYTYTAHRLGITGQVMNTEKMQWLAGVNINTYKWKIDDTQLPAFQWHQVSNNDKPVWTGGITNRFRYNKFSAGADVLYTLNDHFIKPGGGNEWRLSNFYIGYSLNVKDKPLDVYISGRNWIQDRNPHIPDNRRFYGAGFKLEL